VGRHMIVGSIDDRRSESLKIMLCAPETDIFNL
jgi:hypothetical protein